MSRIAAVVALMFLLNRRFADLAVFMLAALIVGGFVMKVQSHHRAVSLGELVRNAGSAGTGVALGCVGFTENPLLLVAVPVGVILLCATKGIARGLERGLEALIVRWLSGENPRRASKLSPGRNLSRRSGGLGSRLGPRTKFRAPDRPTHAQNASWRPFSDARSSFQCIGLQGWPLQPNRPRDASNARGHGPRNGDSMASTETTVAPATTTVTPEENGMTKQQQYVERVQALVTSGLQQSDAIKKVAEENDVKASTIRGALYRHGGTRSNGKQKPPVDPIEAAVQLFRDAITSIDTEMETLKQRADEAKAEYDEAVKTADARRKSYEAKIKALS
jgi:hypothetical protein